MKYIEEIKNGEAFIYQDQNWLLTTDFKHNGQRLCYNLSEGTPRWFSPGDIVDVNPIYVLDKNNNICPVKIYQNDNKNFNVS